MAIGGSGEPRVVQALVSHNYMTLPKLDSIFAQRAGALTIRIGLRASTMA